jgi:hypothetical protein
MPVICQKWLFMATGKDISSHFNNKILVQAICSIQSMRIEIFGETNLHTLIPTSWNYYFYILY